MRAAELSALAEADLRNGLEAMARALFGDVEMRWVDAYFPFTTPSAELEIFFGVRQNSCISFYDVSCIRFCIKQRKNAVY